MTTSRDVAKRAASKNDTGSNDYNPRGEDFYSESPILSQVMRTLLGALMGFRDEGNPYGGTFEPQHFRGTDQQRNEKVLERPDRGRFGNIPNKNTGEEEPPGRTPPPGGMYGYVPHAPAGTPDASLDPNPSFILPFMPTVPLGGQSEPLPHPRPPIMEAPPEPRPAGFDSGNQAPPQQQYVGGPVNQSQAPPPPPANQQFVGNQQPMAKFENPQVQAIARVLKQMV